MGRVNSDGKTVRLVNLPLQVGCITSYATEPPTPRAKLSKISRTHLSIMLPHHQQSSSQSTFKEQRRNSCCPDNCRGFFMLLY
nr:MAG TPA: hypothetical protein [Caudoviricetes sp.]